jgi:hypothetical protein
LNVNEGEFGLSNDCIIDAILLIGGLQNLEALLSLPYFYDASHQDCNKDGTTDRTSNINSDRKWCTIGR